MQRNKKFLSLLLLLLSLCTYAQKRIDTDSLLIITTNKLKAKDYASVKQLSQKALKIAPNYLDFHLLKGSAHFQTQQMDSARYHYQQVITANPKYSDAFIQLVQLEYHENNFDKALLLVNQALEYHPNTIELELKKLELLEATHNETEAEKYLEELQAKYPTNPILQNKISSNRSSKQTTRIGINYNYTTIDRENVGPWQMTTLQCIHEMKTISTILQVHYNDRKVNGISSASGTQYELENYFRHGKKMYSYTDIAYSNSIAFPKWRLGYSLHHSFFNSWEADLGMWYTGVSDNNISTVVAGLTKYIGSYWINLRSYVSIQDKTTYPSINSSVRYYFASKYDYVSAGIGYGTTPDERNNLGLFQDRFRFNSYRCQVGYNKLFGQHYVTGIQAGINRQEYQPKNYQTEYNFSVFVHYKL